MKWWFLLYSCFISLACFTQDIPGSTQQQLENLGDENIKDDALLQGLEFYQKHRLNINSATPEDLQLLRLLTDLQIATLIRYRLLFGKLIDIYELQAVPGFDVPAIQKILPYIYAGDALTLQERLLSRFKNGDQYALFRVSRTCEKPKGYNASLPTHYFGDRNHLLLRYRYQYKNDLYYGVVADKDAGEQFFKGPQKLGFDFYSFHFFARNLGKIKALALGDYVVNLGQGLTQWQSLSFGKSSDVMGIKRQSPVILPYRSAGEFYFNRGAAATIQLKKMEATGFVSYKNFSGNLASDSIDRFTSFGLSGYYRTASEIADRYQLTDLSYGGNIALRTSNFKIGFNAVTHNFSRPLQKTADPYNYFSFSGKHTLNTSVDYSYTFKNMHFFGEAAVDKNLHAAVVQGILISADPKVDISILYRNIGKSYSSLFGNAFTENTLPGNEQGIYTGIVLRPAIEWQVAAYADYYQFPFLKYRTNAPSKGWDYLVQVSYLPYKKGEVYLRYHTENKPIDETGIAQPINFPVEKIKQNLRLHFATTINKDISIKARTELLWFDKKGSGAEEGFLTFIEVAHEPWKKLSGNIRWQYFETGGYNSRIYAYESDVLYDFSIPAFYDKGVRFYCNGAYTFNKQCTIWCRIAQTIFTEKGVIGSGLDEIKGNKRTELTFQLKYKL